MYSVVARLGAIGASYIGILVSTCLLASGFGSFRKKTSFKINCNAYKHVLDINLIIIHLKLFNFIF